MDNIRLPLVSIMIPTYNQAKYIENTIDSALSQDYSNLEIIISDDCSPDETQRICEKYLKKNCQIKYFRNKTNLGRVKNYHTTLFNRAKGEYVLNLDGDDLLTDKSFVSNGIKRILAIKNPDRPLLYIACKSAKKNNKIKKILHKINEENKLIKGEDFIYGLFTKYKFSHLTTIYNRSEALKHNFYSLNVISSDSESLLKLACHSNVMISKDIVGQWCEVDNNESLTVNFNKRLDNLKWISSIDAYLKDKIPWKKRFVWKIKALYFNGRWVYSSLLRKENFSTTNLKYLLKNKYFVYLLILTPFFVIKNK
ncbi:glycosyltransferase family 2 protein [Formosa sediminum]|uniref:Glycosyltransferase family 2 protein n=1 Tax=Formosa sediminum TaxID=2594004 RepID=A0A516GNW9_9FLAO|nr:glycosyltransferase family 2 protein [Formosa sediminum]QDO93226.1 glycosyltransferase family 2 protein [Formosa sediminum]